jgi:polysaccharide biosynthesis/export protein
VFAQPVVRRAIIHWFHLGLLLLTSSCASDQALPPLPPVADQGYRLGPGDQIRMITFGDQHLTGPFRVNDSGAIALPLIGPVRAAGLTSEELADLISKKLEQQNLFRDPSVAVEVAEYRPIFVLGEVNKPGQFPYQPGMTVLTAVAVAGGFTYRAIHDHMAVLRKSDGSPVAGLATGESLLQPGDVVTVYERRF